MSLARRHRQRIALNAAIALIAEAPTETADVAEGTPEGEQMRLRLALDMRRLKEIQSLERKIEAKREMLPDYVEWVDNLLAAADEAGRGVQDEVLVTVMIWRIDVGDYAGAVPLIDYVLRWNLALPERYTRTAATLIVEEIAEAALKRIGLGEDFPIDVLETVGLLTEDADMHDEVRAKLIKAIGLLRVAAIGSDEDATDGAAGARRAALEQALGTLKRARELDARAGVAKAIEKIERDLKKGAASAVAPAQTA